MLRKERRGKEMRNQWASWFLGMGQKHWCSSSLRGGTWHLVLAGIWDPCSGTPALASEIHVLINPWTGKYSGLLLGHSLIKIRKILGTHGEVHQRILLVTILLLSSFPFLPKPSSSNQAKTGLPPGTANWPAAVHFKGVTLKYFMNARLFLYVYGQSNCMEENFTKNFKTPEMPLLFLHFCFNFWQSAYLRYSFQIWKV